MENENQISPEEATESFNQNRILVEEITNESLELRRILTFLQPGAPNESYQVDGNGDDISPSWEDFRQQSYTEEEEEKVEDGNPEL